MRENKMLNLILENIDGIVESFKKGGTFHYGHFFYDTLLEKLHVLCKLVATGAEDEDLEYILNKLQETKKEWNKFSLKPPIQWGHSYRHYEEEIRKAIEACEKRNESVKLLQEGYSYNNFGRDFMGE